jgi:spermidine/putrescine transport system permease protein
MQVWHYKNFMYRNNAFFLSVPALIWQLCFLYLPLLLVLSDSLFAGWQSYTWETLSLENFAATTTMLHIAVIIRSLLQAFVVATCCLLIGYPVTYLFALKVRRLKSVFLFFLMLPFWTNILVHVYAWFFVLERNGLINTVLLKLGVISTPLSLLYTQAAVITVMIYSYLPFMVLPLFSALEKFNTTLIEASLDLGASPTKTFFNITLPLTLPAVRNGFFLVFVPVFGEYAIPTLVGGGKSLNVGSMISAYYLEARNPSLGSAFTVLSSAVVLGVVWCIYHLLAGPRITSVARGADE